MDKKPRVDRAGLLLEDKEQIQSKLGTVLRKKREELGLQQTQMAQEIGISQAYYSYLERGERNPDFYLVWMICKVLGLSLNEVEVALMTDIEKKSRRDAKEQAIAKCLFDLLESVGI